MDTDEKLNALWNKYNRLQDKFVEQRTKNVDLAREVIRLRVIIKKHNRGSK